MNQFEIERYVGINPKILNLIEAVEDCKRNMVKSVGFGFGVVK